MNKTKRITFIALLSALAFVCTLLEITYPFAPWLKLDLSETVILFATTLLGLPAAVITSFLKAGFQLISGDATPYNIGEITALLASLTFATSFFLTKKLNLIIRLIIVSLVFTLVMIVFNFFVSTPIYITQSIDYNNVIALNLPIDIFKINFVVNDTTSYLKMILLIYAPFNLLKALIISTIYILAEKPIKKAFDTIINRH